MPVLPSTRMKKRTYHQTFALREIGGSEIARHTLLINPEDLSYVEPAKNTVTETLGGGYVSDFGSAFKEVVIQGVTGYKAQRNNDGVERDGYTEFLHLRNEIYRRYIESADPKIGMYWYNWEDDDYWRIQPTSFRLLRNKNEPLLYRYEFSFKLLQRMDSGYKSPNTIIIHTTQKSLVDVSNAVSKLVSKISEARSKFKR